MEDILQLILRRIESLEEKLDEVDKKVSTLTKHAPFVDSLAESGAVKAISSLNTVFSSLNPMRYISDNSGISIENID